MVSVKEESESFSGFKNWFKRLKDAGRSQLMVESEKPGELLNTFFTDFKEIKAAGGLVINQMGEALLINRRGRWDLPKGKIEPNEFMRKAALREIREECGVEKLKIIQTIKPTYHIYVENDEFILKTTFWYFVECQDPENAKPQIEEEITEVQWVHPADLHPYIKDTYPNIKSLLMMYGGLDRNYDKLD